MSVPESRSFRFPKSRSKYLDDAVKLAKTLPGFEKSKKHYKVTFGKTDSGSDDLWELLKIASRWKGAVFLFDGKEVEQEVWESSFHQVTAESGAEGAAAVAEEPEMAAEPPRVEEKKPETAAEPPKVEEKKPEKAEEPPKVEEKKPEKAAEPPKVEEKKPEKAEEPPKVEEKKAEKAEEPPKTEEKKPASKPVSVQINPAPKPEDNSGCGKSAAMFAIAALGLLQFFR